MCVRVCGCMHAHFQAAQSLPALPAAANPTHERVRALEEERVRSGSGLSPLGFSTSTFHDSAGVDCEDSPDDMFEIIDNETSDIPDASPNPKSTSRRSMLWSRMRSNTAASAKTLWKAPNQYVSCKCDLYIYNLFVYLKPYICMFTTSLHTLDLSTSALDTPSFELSAQSHLQKIFGKTECKKYKKL